MTERKTFLRKVLLRKALFMMRSMMKTSFAAASLFTAVLCLVLMCAPPQALAQPSDGSAMQAATPDTALGLTVEQAYGESFLYDYGVTPDSVHFKLNVTFRPDEVYWEQLWDMKTETDPTKSVLLDAHRMLASWPEENGFFVVLYADFLRGETSFCGTNNPSDADSSTCMTGTITRTDGAWH